MKYLQGFAAALLAGATQAINIQLKSTGTDTTATDNSIMDEVQGMGGVGLTAADQCADEKWHTIPCSCDGWIYFGTLDSINAEGDFKDGASYLKIFNWGQSICDRGSFGGDPVYGVNKYCYCGGNIPDEDYCATKGDVYNKDTRRCERHADPPAPAITAANFCAAEGQECQCEGTIYYGTLEGIMNTSGENFRMHTSTGSMMCTNEAMKGAYIADHANSCYCDGVMPEGHKHFFLDSNQDEGDGCSAVVNALRQPTASAACGKRLCTTTDGEPVIIGSDDMVHQLQGTAWQALAGAANGTFNDVGCGNDGHIYAQDTTGVFQWMGDHWMPTGDAMPFSAWSVGPTDVSTMGADLSGSSC